MPELCVGERQWAVPGGSNLLDALNEAGLNVPYSCRAGSCHACLVRCLDGIPLDAKPEALAAEKREQGWRLACQCSVTSDLRVALFDPRNDGLPATVIGLDWFADVLRLRLRPERPLRYQAGQHLVLWSDGVARPYSLASLPGEDDFLEFHLDCHRSGAFCDQARQLRLGDVLRLGELRAVRCTTTRTGRRGRSGCWRRVPDWRRCGASCVRHCDRGIRGKFGCCTWHTPLRGTIWRSRYRRWTE